EREEARPDVEDPRHGRPDPEHEQRPEGRIDEDAYRRGPARREDTPRDRRDDDTGGAERGAHDERPGRTAPRLLPEERGHDHQDREQPARGGERLERLHGDRDGRGHAPNVTADRPGGGLGPRPSGRRAIST